MEFEALNLMMMDNLSDYVSLKKDRSTKERFNQRSKSLPSDLYLLRNDQSKKVGEHIAFRDNSKSDNVTEVQVEKDIYSRSVSEREATNVISDQVEKR